MIKLRKKNKQPNLENSVSEEVMQKIVAAHQEACAIPVKVHIVDVDDLDAFWNMFQKQKGQA